ncbi:hypothetical protein PAECIP111893_01830 [Paenibacillus plantiphilus]|uniref:Uncharacterized protein n=1 Tax=Paenibacillus plantiphilus TaxID=2905650 RepID=A0ABN8G826_9BACL|nr:hypothetical protein PAECIP111893_01830 [Paenibacillus plantiphilus]
MWIDIQEMKFISSTTYSCFFTDNTGLIEYEAVN